MLSDSVKSTSVDIMELGTRPISWAIIRLTTLHSAK